MNIFKILANGDGTINEPNVSAFLGYLLDPKEEHGLDDILLRKVLQALYEQVTIKENFKWLVDTQGNIRNLSKNSSFDIEVYFEQAFKENKDKVNKEQKQIVDIVILCYEKDTNKKESLVINSIGGERELMHIILVENKIRKSKNEKQLQKQLSDTIERLESLGIKKPESKVSTIFVTPEEDVFEEEFESLNKINPNSIHIYWNETMINLLKKIIQEENAGKIDPINEYSKHTIKAFITFIENGFQSKIDEDFGKSNVSWNEFKEQNQEILKKQSSKTEIVEKIVAFYKQDKKIYMRHSEDNLITVFKDGGKRFAFKGKSKNVQIGLICRHSEKTEEDLKGDFGALMINITEVKRQTRGGNMYRFLLTLDGNIQNPAKMIIEILGKWLEIYNKY
jgi:hypothetical protein